MKKLADLAIVATVTTYAVLFAGGVRTGTDQVRTAQSRSDAAVAAALK
jgi:hypothetical protein